MMLLDQLKITYSETGGITVLKSNLAPDTGVVKRSAVDPSMLKFQGPARVLILRKKVT